MEKEKKQSLLHKNIDEDKKKEKDDKKDEVLPHLQNTQNIYEVKDIKLNEAQKMLQKL